VASSVLCGNRAPTNTIAWHCTIHLKGDGNVRTSLVAIAVSLIMNAVPAAALAQEVLPAEAQAIAKDAYIYSFAMMENYQTWRSQAVDKASHGYVGGFNVYRHYSEPFTPDNKDVVRKGQ
jgi:hypothetical protein